MSNRFTQTLNTGFEATKHFAKNHPYWTALLTASSLFLLAESTHVWYDYYYRWDQKIPLPIEYDGPVGFLRMLKATIHRDIAHAFNTSIYIPLRYLDKLEPTHPNIAEHGRRIIKVITKFGTNIEKTLFNGRTINTVPSLIADLFPKSTPTPTPTPMP